MAECGCGCLHCTLFQCQMQWRVGDAIHASNGCVRGCVSVPCTRATGKHDGGGPTAGDTGAPPLDAALACMANLLFFFTSNCGAVGEPAFE